MTATLEVKRPVLIWFAVVAGVLVGLYLLYAIFTEFAGQVAPWYRAFLALSGIATIAGMVGMFNMKRWSITLLIVYLTLSQVISLAFNIWNPTFLVPAIFILVGSIYYERME